ncbi:hypothetical protein BJX76DRAFT_326256 [Aspergillus varians]
MMRLVSPCKISTRAVAKTALQWHWSCLSRISRTFAMERSGTLRQCADPHNQALAWSLLGPYCVGSGAIPWTLYAVLPHGQ